MISPENQAILHEVETRRLGLFMRASNELEGEIEPGEYGRAGNHRGVLWPTDIAAAQFFINLPTEKMTGTNIRTLHRMLGAHITGAAWVGKYRKCDVHVGGYNPPGPHLVSKLMRRYWTRLTASQLTPWRAYAEFEAIHPFQDLNGRVGRLIWLNLFYKAKTHYTISDGMQLARQLHYDALAHFEGEDFNKVYGDLLA